VHKTANVLDKMPKRVQPEGQGDAARDLDGADKRNAEAGVRSFIEMFEAKYPKAVPMPEEGSDVLLTFYDFPAEHWVHMRTTNPIESTFATVRLRHRKTKGNGSRRGVPGDGVQAHAERVEEVASAERIEFVDGIRKNAA
jgi:putative transposase